MSETFTFTSMQGGYSHTKALSLSWEVTALRCRTHHHHPDDARRLAHNAYTRGRYLEADTLYQQLADRFGGGAPPLLGWQGVVRVTPST